MDHHHRYKYVPITKRPHYSWPIDPVLRNPTHFCERYLAVYFAINLEHFSWDTTESSMGVKLGAPPPQPPPPVITATTTASTTTSTSTSTTNIVESGNSKSIPPAPDVLNYSWRDYGNRVGAWRLLDLFKDLDLPITLLVNTSCYDYCPELIDAFRKQGAEIVAHGHTNSEAQGTTNL